MYRGTVQCLKFTTFLWLSQLTCVKRITKFQIFNIFLTCLTIYFIQKYNFPMGEASLTFFDFATLRFHFAIFTIVFVIDQINEASPWWKRAEPLLSGWRHIHSWKNQPILMLSIITYLYCQFHPIRRNFTIGVVKYSYFELFDWQFSSTWDGPSQMTKQATRDNCLLSHLTGLNFNACTVTLVIVQWITIPAHAEGHKAAWSLNMHDWISLAAIGCMVIRPIKQIRHQLVIFCHWTCGNSL